MPQSLFAFGSNGNGQLGIGSDEDTSIPLQVQFIPPLPSHIQQQHVHENSIQTPFHDFAAGGNHTVFITRGEKRLYMTGSNKDGELLLQEPTQVFIHHEFLSDLQSKNNHDSSINKEEKEGEDLQRWRSVACGWAFTIAVTEPESTTKPDSTTRCRVKCVNKAYAWGSGAFGELGLGPSLTKTGRKPIAIEKGLLGTNTTTAIASSTSTILSQIEILKVKAGLRHVLLLARENFIDGQEETSRTLLIGWGSNRQGQLGVLERLDGSSEPFTEKELRGKFMEPTRIMIAKEQLTNNHNPQSAPVIVDMACGQNHSLVLFSDGTVYSSGLNKYGQLGPSASSDQEARDFRIGFKKIHGLPFVNSITCGWNHNAAMDTSSLQGKTTIYLWGRDDHGQLGSDIPLVLVDGIAMHGDGTSMETAAVATAAAMIDRMYLRHAKSASQTRLQTETLIGKGGLLEDTALRGYGLESF
ncbi:putative E3 ubiquitin-protein ligase herc4 [Mortierella sp. AD011]|nr:putative E3 ubiquitin-protein ligase herc4 [Mortierella sp. AD010]KAF9401661.1 putative E3 ubiquitin-protein ligase herc4 [Mortierella sp. AD011]